MKASLSTLLAAAGLLLAAAPAAEAQPYYWDNNTATSGLGTAGGTWSSAGSTLWNNDPLGGTAGSPNTLGTPITTAITDALNFGTNTAGFGLATGTITVSGTVSAGTITYGSQSGSVTLSGGTIDLAAASTVTVNTAAPTIANGATPFTSGTWQFVTSTLSGAGTNFTKAGTGALVLNSTTNTFNPGSISVTGGILLVGGNTATTLNNGSYAGNIAISGGATFMMFSTSAQTLGGVISGAGNFVKRSSGNITLTGDNTYTGRTSFQPQTATGFTATVSSFNSVVGGVASSSLGAPTSVSNGTIDVGNGGIQAGVNLTYVGTGETTDRVINWQFNGTASHTLTANGSGLLRFTSAMTSNAATQTGQLILSGTGSGEITQNLPALPTGGLSKTGTGTWTISGNMSHTGGLNVSTVSGGTLNLSGTNTYSGATVNAFSNPGTGSLVFRGMQSLSSNTFITQTHVGGSGGFGVIKLLDDSAAPVSRSTVNLTFTNSNGSQNAMAVFVGNNSVSNGGTSTSTQTGSTIQLGNMNFTQGAANVTQGIVLLVTGANDYKLQLANLNVNLVAASNTAYAARVQADAPVIVTATVRQTAGSGGTTTLTLDGAARGSLISGNVLNSADGTPKVLTLAKTGSGTWTLSGINSYTGTTTVSGGILRITGDSSGATGNVTVSGGALGGNAGSLGGAVTASGSAGMNLVDGSVGSLTLGSTLSSTGALGANNFFFDLASAGSTTDTIAATGAFSMTTSGAVVVSVNQLGGSASRLAAGTYDILTAASSLTPGGGQFRLATTRAFGQTFSLSDTTDTALKLTTTQVTSAVGNTTLSGSNPSWTAGANFTGGLVPDYQSNVTINSAIGTSPLNGSTNINSLTYGTSATTGTTISAGTASAGTLASMLVIEAAAVNGNAAGNGITLNNASGTHTISANVGLAANQTWTVASGATLNVTGVISDFGAGYSLTKSGSGYLVLSGAANPAHTFVGPVTINGGGVLIGTAGFGSGNGNITINGGYIEQYFGNSFTRTLGVGAGQIQILGGTSGFSGQGATGSSFTITGQTNNELVWGTTYFNPTVLVAGASTANANGKGTLTNNIDLNGSTRTITSTQNTDTATTSGFTLSGVIRTSSGTAGLTKTGGGRVILTGANTYNGATTINAGALQAGVVSVANVSGAFGRNSAIILADVSSAVMNITGFNTQIGSLTGGGTTGGNVVLGAATLTIGGDNSSPAAYAGVISGAGGAIAKIGTGTLTLSRANTYTGPTQVNAGTLSVANATGSGTGTNAITVSGTSNLAGTGFIAPAANNGLTVATGASLTPGGATGLGVLTVGTAATNNPVTMSSGSFFRATINAANAAGTPFDTGSPTYSQLTLLGNGAIALNGTLSVTLTGGYTPTGTDVYVIVNNQTGNDLSGQFGSATSGTTTNGLFDFLISYTSDSTGLDLSTGGNSVALYSFTPVPEPGTVLGLAAAGMGLAGWGRRRRGR